MYVLPGQRLAYIMYYIKFIYFVSLEKKSASVLNRSIYGDLRQQINLPVKEMRGNSAKRDIKRSKIS